MSKQSSPSESILDQLFNLVYEPIDRNYKAWQQVKKELAQLRSEEMPAAAKNPIKMLLWCPSCGTQHVDAELWDNPPHRSHKCHHCFTVWRPADVETEGVRKINTRSDKDTWTPGQPAAPIKE